MKLSNFHFEKNRFFFKLGNPQIYFIQEFEKKKKMKLLKFLKISESIFS